MVEKSSPVLVSPTKGRARPPAFNNVKASSFKSDDGTYDFIPEPDYSPPPSPKTPSAPSAGTGSSSFTREQQASGVYKRRISTGDEVPQDNRGPGVYQRVLQGDKQSDIPPHPSSGKQSKANLPPGAVNVMSDFKQMPKLRQVNKSFDKSFESDSKLPSSPGSSGNDDSFTYDNTRSTNVKQAQHKQDNVYINEPKDKSPEKSDKPVSPRYKTKQAPPAPCAVRPAPPPPAPLLSSSVPAPPPLGPFDKVSRGRLKQVHWNRTAKTMVSIFSLGNR